jgi:type IV secretion system protein VirD4
MIRTATMIGAILLGLFVGRLIGGFVLTVIAAVGPVGPGVSIPVLVFTSLLGGFIGFLRWRRWWPDGAASDAHGSARFSREEEIARTLGGDEGLIVGRSMRGKLLRYNGPAHLLTIAPSQAGKGVGTIIPNSLTLRRSVLCVDPKGENTRITVAARARMGPVFVLDPFDVSGQPCAAFNPLSALDPDSLDLVDDVAAIAEALVYDPPNQAGEAHWNEEAKALISGVILHVVTTAPAYLRSLITVRDFLTAAPDAFAKMLKAMQDSGAAAHPLPR